MRYAVCSLVMQRVVGMTHVAKEAQQAAHAYALRLLAREEDQVDEDRV